MELGGVAVTGAAGTTTVTVRDPDDSATLSPAVSETANGEYFFTVTAAFTTTNGAGEYGINISESSTPLLGGDSVRFDTTDLGDLAVIRGLLGGFYFLDSTTYDANGFLTTGRIRVFNDATDTNAATDGGSGEGEIATVTFTGTADGTHTSVPDILRGILT